MKNKSADGLRGIAALNVAITHFVAAFLPSMLHKNYPSAFPANPAPDTAFNIVTSPLATILYNGHFAVLIFFALSGYVLTMPYFSAQPQTQAQVQVLQKRFWGRYLRLNIPIAVAVLLSWALYHVGLYANQQVAPVSGSTRWLTVFYQDGITASTMLREASYESLVMGAATLVPPLWTLKVEFIGSLYVLAFYLARPRRTLAPMLMAFLMLYAVHKEESIYYYVIFLGASLNAIRIGPSAKLLLCALGLYFGSFQFESAAYDFLPMLYLHGVDLWDKKNFYNAIGALCLTAAVVQGFGQAVFEHRIVQFLARISFSLYLLHFMILCSLAANFYLYFPQTKVFLAANFVLYLGVCFIAALLFEKYIDRGAIHVSHRFSSKLFS